MFQKFTEEKERIIKKMSEDLNATLAWGIFVGLFGILSYGIFIHHLGWRFIGFSFMMAAACYVSGFFLGILFGIPKRNNNNDKQSEYILNNNLADISDWLTKIIIGLGLVELKTIPGHLQSAGFYVKNAINPAVNSLSVFAICCIVYFTVFGLYYGYIYMRLYLSRHLKDADNNLLNEEKEFNETKEQVQKMVAEQKIIPEANTESIGKEAGKKFSQYNEQLKSLKKEEEYTFDDWYFKGIDAYNKKENEKAISYMKNALGKKAPGKNSEADAYIYIAIAYGEMLLYEKAIEFCNKVIEEYRDYDLMYLAYYNKSWALNNLSRHAESLTMSEKAIELKPDYHLAWTSKSNSLIHLERYEDGLKAAEKVIELKPDYHLGWNNKSVALNQLKRYNEGLEAANKAVKLDPNFSNSWYCKAISYAGLSEKTNMLDNLKTAISLDPKWKANSKTNANFSAFWDDPDFKKITE